MNGFDRNFDSDQHMILFVSAGWMVYPALTPGFKSQLGLEDNIKPANIEYVEEEDGSTPTLA